MLFSDGGLFLACLCAGAVRRNEGFLLEPVHSVSVEKLFLLTSVLSEMVISGRMGEGSYSKCVVAWGQQSLVSPALLYCSFEVC